VIGIVHVVAVSITRVITTITVSIIGIAIAVIRITITITISIIGISE
jgi:hypothetical protein